MIDTFTALAVTALALVPGALYTWAFERQVGAWGSSVSDRLLRFVGASALMHAVLAWPDYLVYERFVRSGDLSRGDPLPPWAWTVPIGLVLLPILIGTWVGNETYHRTPWTRFLVGRSPAPRAWDHLFARANLTGWVIIHRKNDDPALAGTWVRSPDGRRRSYAAGYPEPQDIFLLDTAQCDPATGEFLLDQHGRVQFRGVSVLIRWDEIAYLEFIEG